LVIALRHARSPPRWRSWPGADAGKVRSATFFTAQVDFDKAGDLKSFIDDGQIKMLEGMVTDGYPYGRYLAATFNLLRGPDLIWNYVVNNYLMGESYPAFDLLHWNGDTTNLPAKWHKAYLEELYRDNRLVIPDFAGDRRHPDRSAPVSPHPATSRPGAKDHIAPAEARGS